MTGKARRDEILLTQGAEQDLESIHDYIAEFDSVAHANHVLDRLMEVVDGLARFPDRGRSKPTPWSRTLKRVVRRLKNQQLASDSSENLHLRFRARQGSAPIFWLYAAHPPVHLTTRSSTTMFSRSLNRWLAVLGVALFLPAVQAAPPPPPPPPGTCTTISVQGTLTNFRTGPKGDVNGFYLDTAPGSSEVHFPPHEAARVQALVALGSTTSVTGCLHTGPGGQTHVRAKTISNLQTGQSVVIAAPTAPPPPTACTPVTVMGGVQSYRYAPRGELDGLVLDTSGGAISVRFPPHEGYRVQAALPIGSQASVTGCTHTNPYGNTHLNAQTLTNVQTGATVAVGRP